MRLGSNMSLDGNEWQGKVGDSWASEWARTDRSFTELTEILISRVLEKAGQHSRILDIGCGAGQTTLELAQQLPNASITGIDLSANLISAANARHVGGTNIKFETHDATTWNGGDWQPDLLLSRHGVMFFNEPVSAFSYFADISAPGAKLVFSCFRDRTENDWVSEILELLPDVGAPDPHAPGPFAFADENHVSDILARAGWKNAKAEAIDFSYIASGGSDPIADATDFFSHIGPAARLIRSLDEQQRRDFFGSLSPILCNHLQYGEVRFKAAAWIWTAHL